MNRRWRDLPRMAAGSGLGWLALAALHGEWLAHTLLGFAIVTVVPLGLALALEGGTSAKASERERAEVPFFYRLALLLLPGLLVGGFFVFSGLVGTLPSVMSAGVVGMGCAAIGFYGLQRLIRRGLRPRTELAIDLGCMLLPVGAVWLFASRLGLPFLGFHEPTVLLTAEHFFHAGFGAPIVFGVLGRHLPARAWLVRAHGTATTIVCAAIPLTAVGIAVSRTLEVPSAVLLTVGVAIGAVCMLVVAAAQRRDHAAAAALLAISGVSLFGSMTLAAAWAMTGSGKDAVAGSAMTTLEQMVRWHGAVNSFGFLGAGLVGLTLLELRKGR